MRRPAHKYILAVIDGVIVLASCFVAARIAETAQLDPLNGGLIFSVLTAMATVIIFRGNHLYRINVFLTKVDHSARILRSLMILAVGMVIINFAVFKLGVLTRSFLLFYVSISFLLFLLLRVFVYRRAFTYLAGKNLMMRRILLVGAGLTGRMAAANLEIQQWFRTRIVGFVDDNLASSERAYGDLTVLGKISDVPLVTKLEKIEEILICLDDVSHEKLIEVVDLCMTTGVLVSVSSPLYGVLYENVIKERFGKIPIAPLGSNRTNGYLQSITKRSIDLLFSSLALVIFFPLWLIIGLLIKLDSPGTVFFSQIRIGKNGKPFRFYKFRSMAAGSDNDERRMRMMRSFIKGESSISGTGNQRKLVDESKVTGIGRFLRKTSIDEFPQMLNVIQGQMSLVGPRPCLPYEWEHYAEWQRRRLNVLPGCTGIWQVYGRSKVGFDDMVVLDLYYIYNSSTLLDLELMVKTIPVMISGRGAK